MLDLLKDLNDAQREAVEYINGPSQVIAGAGSGKTRVLTYKVAYLLQHGLRPWEILALTFTNKAAREMRERIALLVGDNLAPDLRMGTFHSVFARILRTEAPRMGYASNYTIYDDADSRSLVKNIVKELGLDDKVYKPSAVLRHISMAKNHLITADDYASHAELVERDGHKGMPEVGHIYKVYQARCKQCNAMDFDDLLLQTYLLFNGFEDVRRHYAARFRFVLVDEYQDTNFAQQQIVLQLTQESRRVCVVGDDAQSIYAFRGAEIDNILDFAKHFPEARLFKLEQNYRSTQLIVQAANSLIEKNSRRIPKEVYSHNDEGERVKLREAYSGAEEAVIVCNEIKRLMASEHSAYNDFAILYRTNAQSRAFEDEMLKRGVPYRVYGGLSFYQRKEIKDVIAYFRVVVNPDDEEALRRIINYPRRGIGDTTVEKVAVCARRNDTNIWAVIKDMERYSPEISAVAAKKLAAFAALIDGFVARNETDDAYTLGEHIVKESGISTDLYSEDTPEAQAKQENLLELMGALQDFVADRQELADAGGTSLRDYLQEVSLLSDLDSDGNEDENRKVTLMTIHAAKGLEFPTVFVVGMEDSIFPSAQSKESKRQLEEERRLLYVAITRAERHCYLTYAKSRWLYGKMEFSAPSCFLRDIDPQLLDTDDINPFGSVRSPHNDADDANRSWHSRRGSLFGDSRRWQNANPVATQFRADPKPREADHHEEAPRDPFSPAFKRTFAAHGGNLRRLSSLTSGTARSASSASRTPSSVRPSASSPRPASPVLTVGNTIEHERFGIGTVVQMEGSGENTKATVAFRNSGTKQLLLKFAHYKIVK